MAAFLVDASLPRSTADLVRRMGHLAVDIRDIELGSAPDAVVAEYARSLTFCLLTRDLDFGNIRDYPPQQFHGIVVIRAPDIANRNMVLGIVEEFLGHSDIIEQLSGRLAVVDIQRIRLRPAP